MSKYAAVNVKFGADISGFSTAMQNASRQMQKAGQQLQDVGRSMTMNLTAPIVALGAAALYSFGQIDALKRGLISFSGTAAAAEDEFVKLREVAKLPGIGLEEAVKGSINLQAIGMSADDARTAMMAFGNAIATVGGGRENFELAIRGFGQLRNASRPLQQDLYQIANQLPQVNKLMIEAFGTNRAEDLAAMGMSGKQLADFLITELGKLPQVSGGIKNSFENMSDSIKIAAGQIGQAIDQNFDISGKLTAFADWIGRVADGFQNLQPWVQKTILVVTALVAAIGPLLLIIGGIVQIMPIFLAGFAAIQGAIAALTLTFAPLMLEIGLLVAAIAAMVTIGVFLYSNWEAVKVNMINLFKDLARSILGAIQIIVDGLDWLFSKFGNNTFGTISALFDGMINNVAANEKAKEFKTIGESFTDTWESVKSALMKPVELGSIGGLTSDSKSTKKPSGVEDKETGRIRGNELAKKYGEENTTILNNLRKEVKKEYDGLEEVHTVGISSINKTVQQGALTFGEKMKSWVFVLDENAQGFTEKWNKFGQEFKDAVVNFSDIIAQELERFAEETIVSFFDKLGTNIGQQKNPFDDLGNNLLESIGSFMKKIGALFIAMGVNQEIFNNGLKAMNPYLMIAAGAALVGIGAAITSASKGGLEGARSGGSAGNVSTSSGTDGDMVLYSRLDGKDLVLSGQRTSAIGRR